MLRDFPRLHLMKILSDKLSYHQVINHKIMYHMKKTLSLLLSAALGRMGAASTVDFPDRVAGRLPGGTWGPLHPVSVSAPGSARQAPEPAAARALATDVNLLGQLIYDNGNEYNPDGNDWLGSSPLPTVPGRPGAWPDIPTVPSTAEAMPTLTTRFSAASIWKVSATP